jgi:hypothetical protein
MNTESKGLKENLTMTINETDTPNPDPKPIKITIDRYFWIKFALIFVIILATVLNSAFGFVLPSSDVKYFKDATFEWTADINKHLNENKSTLYALLIISSLCIDFVSLSLFTHWVCYSKSWQILFATGMFYTFRAMIQVNSLLNI